MVEEGLIIQIGDVCYLKSGSPKLTVVAITNAGQVEVAWMIYETAEFRTATVPGEALKIIKSVRTA